jgi:hypothetical protein
VVVVFPSLPVTPVTRHGQTVKNSAISPVIRLPPASALKSA